jgi:tRNA (mo5U34)-methyltransferase
MTLESSRRAGPGDDSLARRIGELGPWFHNLHLPAGRQTAPDHPLGDFPAFKWAEIADSAPTDLRGARALDIGCNAGFYSFELAARGAEVLAIDLDERYLEQARWAAVQLDPEERVEFRRMHVYELGSLGERFDLILFLGVLYHLRYPLLALDLAAQHLAGRLIVQTLTMPDAAQADGYDEKTVPGDLGIDERTRLREPDWPKAAFIEHGLAGDPTNWWAPDDSCVRAMLRSSGLEVLATPAHETYVCEPGAESAWEREVREAEARAATGA